MLVKGIMMQLYNFHFFTLLLVSFLMTVDLLVCSSVRLFDIYCLAPNVKFCHKKEMDSIQIIIIKVIHVVVCTNMSWALYVTILQGLLQ